jgi:hypothetical protein
MPVVEAAGVVVCGTIATVRVLCNRDFLLVDFSTTKRRLGGFKASDSSEHPQNRHAKKLQLKIMGAIVYTGSPSCTSTSVQRGYEPNLVADAACVSLSSLL